MSACQRPSAIKLFVLRPFCAWLSTRTRLSSKCFCNCSPQPVSGRLFSCLWAIVESPARKTVIGPFADARGASSRTKSTACASFKAFTSAELVNDLPVDLHVLDHHPRDVFDDARPG